MNDCPDGAVFLAAVSGGADSMAMLAALCALRQKLPCMSGLFCIHVEHGLRSAEESCGDAEFVGSYCREQGVECRIEHIQPGRIAAFARRKRIGIEAAARFFRRQALKKYAAYLSEQTGCANVRILTAHTKNDMLETTLMRFLRGCGPAGLAAMPVESREEVTKNNDRLTINREFGYMFVRPLLTVTRAEVVSYLQAKGVLWREDATNKDEMFLRNKIRRRLVPLLDEAFPSWKAGVSAMSKTQSLIAGFITQEAQTRIKWKNNNTEKSQIITLRSLRLGISAAEKSISPQTPKAQGKNSLESLFTEAERFFAQPQIIREEAVFQALDFLLKGTRNLKSVKRAVIRKFCEGNVKAADLGAVRIRLDEGKVIISRIRKEFFECGVSRFINPE